MNVRVYLHVWPRNRTHSSAHEDPGYPCIQARGGVNVLGLRPLVNIMTRNLSSNLTDRLIYRFVYYLA